jgi:hypothetical protein
VTAALNKDMQHESLLRDALIQFRKDVSPGVLKCIITIPTLIHAFAIFNWEWDNLYQASGNNYDKCNLVWRQVIGYLQRSLSAVDRFAFARLHDLVENKKQLERKIAHKYSDGSFPDSSLFGSLGFDYAIACRVWRTRRGPWCGGWRAVGVLQKLMSNKNNRLAKLMPLHPALKSGLCVII